MAAGARNMKTGSAITALILMMLSAAELLHVYMNWPEVGLIGCAALLLLVISLLRSFQLREWILLSIAATVGLLLMNRDGDWSQVLASLQRASFFAAFIYLVTLLKEAAQLSPSVLELGSYLTRQKRGRRYYSLAVGGHAMGVLLNFGAISLLTPLIQRGVAASTNSHEEAAKAEQQQISALLRGFSWMIMWSPTALTQAVLFTTFPAINLLFVMSLGLAASAVMIFVGRILDRLSGVRSADADNGTAPVFPVRSAWRFGTICAILILSTYLVLYLANVSGAIALMLVAPVVMVAWLFWRQVEQRNDQPVEKTWHSFWDIVVGSANTLGKSAIVLGAAGFIGDAAAKMTPTSFVAETLGIATMPSWLFLCLLAEGYVHYSRLQQIRGSYADHVLSQHTVALLTICTLHFSGKRVMFYKNITCRF